MYVAKHPGGRFGAEFGGASFPLNNAIQKDYGRELEEILAVPVWNEKAWESINICPAFVNQIRSNMKDFTAMSHSVCGKAWFRQAWVSQYFIPVPLMNGRQMCELTPLCWKIYREACNSPVSVLYCSISLLRLSSGIIHTSLPEFHCCLISV